MYGHSDISPKWNCLMLMLYHKLALVVILHIQSVHHLEHDVVLYQ